MAARHCTAHFSLRRPARHLALLLVLCAGAVRAAVSNSFSLGADYSSQRYSVFAEDSAWYEVEKDTLATDTEARGTWTFDYRRGGDGADLGIGNRLSLSTASIYDNLSFQASRRLGPRLELAGSNDAALRLYHRFLPGADTAYRRDYFDNAARLELRFRPAEPTRLAMFARADLGLFPRPDSFSYNYVTGRVGASLRQELGLLSAAEAGVELARRFTRPDQRYDEISADAGIDGCIGAGPRAALSASAARRRYADPGRSYLEAGPTLDLEFDVSDAFSVSLEDEARATWYDSAAGVYTDFFENSARLELEYRVGADIGLRLVPRFDFGRGLAGPGDEDYREPSLGAGLDLARTDRLWLSAEDRVGVRRFPNADTLFAGNYAFNELSLMLDWTILRSAGTRLALSASATVSPEWHAVDTDDFLSRVFSLELRWGP